MMTLFIMQKLSYITDFENWMHWVLYVSIIAFIWPPYFPPCYINWSFGVLASFVAWMNFIFILQRYDRVFSILNTLKSIESKNELRKNKTVLYCHY